MLEVPGKLHDLCGMAWRRLNYSWLFSPPKLTRSICEIDGWCSHCIMFWCVSFGRKSSSKYRIIFKLLWVRTWTDYHNSKFNLFAPEVFVILDFCQKKKERPVFFDVLALKQIKQCFCWAIKNRCGWGNGHNFSKSYIILEMNLVTHVPMYFCKQEYEKRWYAISSVWTNSPPFPNKHISLLHQNGMVMLRILTHNA